MRRGFTLLEVLLALAVIALLATVLVGGSATLLRDRSASIDDVFWKACQAARKTAVKTGNPFYLSYDDKTKAFVVDDGSRPQSFPIPSTAKDVAINFLQASGDQSEVLIGGVAVATGDAPPVIFFPDGTCTPFKVQIMEAGSPHILSIDPWTCAQVLTKKTDA